MSNCIAIMEVGCLRNPGVFTIGSQLQEEDCSPMTGKSWQPSHEPPHSKRNRHSSHCWKSRKREGKEVAGELPRRWAATLQNARERLLYICHAMLRYDPQAHGIPTDTCAYVSTQLNSRGKQALFVVNSVKLHLTTLHSIIVINLFIGAVA